MLRSCVYVLLLVVGSSVCWSQSAPALTPTFVARHGSSFINRRPAAAVYLAPSALPATTPSQNNGLAYNGGPIMDDANGVNVYFIWYGDWSHDQLAQKVLINFITHIGGSPYFNINTTYYSLESGPSSTKLIKDRVVNAVHYMGSATDKYSQGANLSDYQVYLAVANAITSGALPADQNGVYFLLTSGDVYEAEFGNNFCAWHDSTQDAGVPPVDGVDVKFSWVPNAAIQFAYNCIWDYQTTVSGSLSADGMANFMAHELEESVTDPDITSWVNLAPFNENGDLCDFVFPGPYHSGSASDPQPPDMKFDGIPYLIQENWVNAKGGYCAIRWDD